MAASKPKQKKFIDRGRVFSATARNGKVKVKLERTARGQNITVGTLNLEERKWENTGGKAYLPTHIRVNIEKIFLGSTVSS